MKPVCIIGMGLIGGSIFTDLTAAGHPVFGSDRDGVPAALARARAEDALVVIATPFPAVGGILDQLDGQLFTDVVSVKQAVWEQVQARGLEDFYTGGHPMAGATDSTWRRGLFHDAPWLITYHHLTEAFPRTLELVRALGARPVLTTPAAHDAAVARISHLPHVFAETLAIVGKPAAHLGAGSFRDGTRVAQTPPHLVEAMLENNAPALVDALDEALAIMQKTRDSLAANASIGDLAERGYACARRDSNPQPSDP